MINRKQKFWALEFFNGQNLVPTKLALCFFSFALFSCTKSEAPIKSAAKSIPQIYYLGEKAKSWWSFVPKSLEGSLGVRTVELEAKSPEDASKALQEWSARPIDLLILGPGVAQQSYLSLRLPKNKDRKVLFLNSKHPDFYSLEVDDAELKSFLVKFCQEFCQNKCFWDSIEPGQGQKFYNSSEAKCRVQISPADNNHLNLSKTLFIELNWSSIINRVLASELGQRNFVAKISSADLKLSLQSKDNDPELKTRFQSLLKEFSLENLK